jgi:hypothetical protein
MALLVSTAGVSACAPLLGGSPEIDVRPVSTMPGANPDSGGDYASAVAAINRRDYALALDYLQAARTKEPQSARVLNAFGVVYDKLGRFDLSARYYDQARTVEPDSKIIADNIAYSQMLQGLENPHQTLALADPVIPDVPKVPAHLVSAVGLVARLPPVSLDVPTLPAERVATESVPPIADFSNKITVLNGNQPPRATQARPTQLAAASTAVVEKTFDPAEWRAPFHHARLVKAAPIKSGLPLGTISFTEVRLPPATSLLTGYPLIIIDASGRENGAEPVRRSLAALGWTARLIPSPDAHIEKTTSLFYPQSSTTVAHGLLRTLPFRTEVAPTGNQPGSMRLVIGSDFLSWLPAGNRVPSLWRKFVTLASLEQPAKDVK